VGRASRAEGQRSVGPPYKSKTLGAGQKMGAFPKKGASSSTIKFGTINTNKLGTKKQI